MKRRDGEKKKKK